MILADKIIALRKKNGWSQEELAELLDVSRQSISKWEGAQSVPDMNRILKMSEVFGVSTDYLLKDALEAPEVIEAQAVVENGIRSVSMEEATAFLRERNTFAGRVAIGVMLCILSPVLLIVLAGAQEAGVIAMAESAAAGIGLLVLMVMVGCAVALFVLSGTRMAKYEYLEKEPIDTAYGVSGMAAERRERFKDTHTKFLTIGIVMCVLSVVPVFLALILFGEAEFPMLVATGVLLAIVAVGVFFIVRVSVIWGSFQMLLEEGAYTRSEKESQKNTGPVTAIYWLAVTALFLGYSFYTGSWKYSGYIWAIAGVVFGIVMTVTRLLQKKG